MTLEEQFRDKNASRSSERICSLLSELCQTCQEFLKSCLWVLSVSWFYKSYFHPFQSSIIRVGFDLLHRTDLASVLKLPFYKALIRDLKSKSLITT